MTARRRHRCDCCDYPRQRWQRLCDVCWARLPADIRYAVVGNWKTGDKRAWRAAVKRGLQHFDGAVARHLAAQRHAAAITGERDLDEARP